MDAKALRFVIGTLAHNRAFTAREITEYTRFDHRSNGTTVIAWLKRQGYVALQERNTYYPTAAGWNWIEGGK